GAPGGVRLRGALSAGVRALPRRGAGAQRGRAGLVGALLLGRRGSGAAAHAIGRARRERRAAARGRRGATRRGGARDRAVAGSHRVGQARCRGRGSRRAGGRRIVSVTELEARDREAREDDRRRRHALVYVQRLSKIYAITRGWFQKPQLLTALD